MSRCNWLSVCDVICIVSFIYVKWEKIFFDRDTIRDIVRLADELLTAAYRFRSWRRPCHHSQARGDRCCYWSSRKYRTFGQGPVVFCHPGRNSLKLPSMAVLPRFFLASRTAGRANRLKLHTFNYAFAVARSTTQTAI